MTTSPPSTAGPASESSSGAGDQAELARLSQLTQRSMSEVKRVIVGQEHMVEQLMVALIAGGHVPARGRAGHGEDARGADLRRRGRRDVHPHPVHARPGAVRHRRHPDLPAEQGGVRRRARTGLRQLRDRRRDQPRAGQGAVGDARADGRAPGLDRRPDLPAARPVHRDRDPEPDRVRGRLPAARGAARPVPASRSTSAPARAGGVRDPAPDEVDPPRASGVLDPETDPRAAYARPTGSSCTTWSRSTSSDSCWRPARRRSSTCTTSRA